MVYEHERLSRMQEVTMRKFNLEDDDDYAFLMMLVLVVAVSLMAVAVWFVVT